MDDDRYEAGNCETCSVAIMEGDLSHHTADGCWLCKEHSQHLSDVIQQHEEMLIEPDGWMNSDLDYDSRDELLMAVQAMKNRLASHGDELLVSPA